MKTLQRRHRIVIALVALVAASCHSAAPPKPSRSAFPTPTFLALPTPLPALPRNVPICQGSGLSVVGAAVGQGSSGGGVTVSIDLATTRTCRLQASPIVTILDAHDRALARANADITIARRNAPYNTSNTVRADAYSHLYGTWYGFCTKSTKPFHVRLDIAGTSISHHFETPTLPLCLDTSGAVQTPSASRPTGRLDLHLVNDPKSQ